MRGFVAIHFVGCGDLDAPLPPQAAQGASLKRRTYLLHDTDE